jgi:dUTP pyrophosphatase
MKFLPMHKNFKAPVYSTSGSAAFDIHCTEDITVTSEPRTVKLGFASQIPKGHAGLLMPRSGLGTKLGMKLSNTVGLIDSDYRGEWMATISISSGSHTFAAGDRILQCMIVPVLQVAIEVADSLDETERGTGGYGSTGL